MRPRIHGWIIGLLLFGASGIGVIGFLVRYTHRRDESAPVLASALFPGQSTRVAILEHATDSGIPSDWDREHGDTVGPSASESPRSGHSLPAARTARARLLQTPPGAQRSEITRQSGTGQRENRSGPRQSQDARLEPIIQVGHELIEPDPAAGQDQKPAERKPVSQFTRPVSNTPPQQPAQETQVIQMPEAGQVPANIGQVDVQALDQLGVVILKGTPQDVENMKKIIEEIQRISEGVEPFIRVFQLQRASATQVRDTIMELYAGSTSTTGSTQRTTTGQATTGQGGGSSSAASVLPTPALRRFQIAANERSNTLTVLASPQMMEELSRLIDRLDIDGAPVVSEVRVFPLKNAEATELANILTQAISGEAAGTTGETIGGTAATVSGGGEVRISNRGGVLKFVPLDGESRAIESGILDEVRVTAQIRTNSVIVSAPASCMPLLGAIIAELDKPPSIVASMKVYELKNADATNLRITLAELFDLEPSTGTLGAGAAGTLGTGATTQFQRPIAVTSGESPPVSIRVGVDERTNSLIVSGPENAVLQVEAVIRRLDLSDLHNRKSRVYRLKNLYALDVAATLQQYFTTKRQLEAQTAGLTAQQGTIVGPYQRLEQDVVIVALDNSLAASLTTAANVTTTATPATQGVSNMLLISASPRYFDQVIKMIDDLDAPQPQVMIQCIIAQLTLNDDYEFGIEFGLQNDVLFDRGNLPFTSTSTATNTTAGLTTVTNNAAGTLPGTPGFNFNSTGPLGNTALARAAQVGGQGLSNFALGRASLIDGLANVGGLVLTGSSKNVTALLRALQNDGRLEVISRPQIMTLDGRTARVSVGESFPYIGSVTTTETATIPTVNFTNIGVILTVKPSITPDDRIYLEVVPEVSELKEIVNVQQITTTTGTLNQQAPRITQTTANTVVSINDGQTIVLGGLIQKRHADFMRKIPWLGDLPHIGFLFRFTQQRELRQELLIIMTPHIVRNEADAQRIKDLEVARVNWIINEAAHAHGDLGLTQGEVLHGPADLEPMPIIPDGDSPVIQPMSGHQPIAPAGPPPDWAAPADPKTSPGNSPNSNQDGDKKSWGDKVRGMFSRG